MEDTVYFINVFLSSIKPSWLRTLKRRSLDVVSEVKTF